MNKKGLTIAGIFALAIVIGMFVMRGIGTGVQATNSDADFQITGTRLVSYTGTSRSVSIPSTVTEIGNQAFAGNTTINMVTIPYSVTKIGYRAFSECTNLKNVDIPDAVTNIGPGAFYNCTSLNEVSIGEGVSSLGSGAFAGCSALQTVTIDSDNPYLLYYAGALYNGNMTMLYQVFAGREGENFVMPNTVEEIDTYAFWECQNIKNVAVSTQVKDIAAYAMTNMNSVENVVLTTGTTTISEKAFADNDALRQISIPVSVSTIHDTAFDNCPNLKILTQSNTTAENYAENKEIPVIRTAEIETSFEDSKAGELIPEDITDTDNEDNEEADTEEENSADEEEESSVSTPLPTENPLDAPESDDVVGKTIIINGQAVVLVNNRTQKVYGSKSKPEEPETETESEEESESEGESKAEEETAVEEETKVEQEDSTEEGTEDTTQEDATLTTATNESSIAERAYYKNVNLTRYTIPNTTKTIGKLAFARTGLISITIPDSVTTIDYGAFYDCEDLNNVTISNQVQNIEAKAFAQTAWLENWLAEDAEVAKDDPYLIVGDGILLAYRGSATSIMLPDTVKQIGAECFKGHEELVTVIVPESVTKIGAKAFAGCTALEGLRGCEGLRAIVLGAFSDTNVTEETYRID